MKGLEMPINMIVVVAIAVLVLVVVAAFFAGRLGGGSDEIALTAAFNTGCNTLRSVHNCVVASITSGSIRIPGYAPPGEQVNPNGYDFSLVCSRKGYSASDCARVCGCTIGTSSGGFIGGTPPPSPPGT